MTSAWMIRNDGVAIPRIQHIYANSEEAEETLAAAQWLYLHTKHVETKRLALETIAAWADGLHHDGPIDVVRAIQEAISNRPYQFLTKEFITRMTVEIEAIPVERFNLQSLCREVTAELNQEFMRARYGGKYHTKKSSREMFFRISSIGFEWHGIIRGFVSSASFPIESITVVRDEESTGVAEGFYPSSDGQRPYRAFPVQSFLREPEPITEPPEGASIHQRILAGLASGDSFRQLQSLPINRERLAGKLQMLAARENHFFDKEKYQ